MKKNIFNNFGFSVIEIIVYVAILGVFISLVFGTIFFVNKSNERIKNANNIQNDVRSVFDYMISNIDSLGINYNYYKNGNNYNISLPIHNIALNSNMIYRKTNNCYSNFSCIEISYNNGVSYQKITSSNVNISNLDFYFLDPDSYSMPLVTVVLSGYIKDNRNNNYNFSYQNTVEIKNYIK